MTLIFQSGILFTEKISEAEAEEEDAAKQIRHFRAALANAEKSQQESLDNLQEAQRRFLHEKTEAEQRHEAEIGKIRSAHEAEIQILNTKWKQKLQLAELKHAQVISSSHVAYPRACMMKQYLLPYPLSSHLHLHSIFQ